MQAVTIRRASDNHLVAFGPANGMYDPVIPADCIRATEPNYDTVLAEWEAAQAPPPDVVGFLAALRAAFPLAQRALIARQYPWFLKAVEDQQWADVRGYLALALSEQVLSQAQIDTIRAIATAHNIPLT